MADETQTGVSRRTLASLGGLAVCVFLWPALVTFDIGDWPSPHQYPHNQPPVNACGPVGAWCSYYLHNYLGDGSYPLLLFATCAALLKLFRGKVGHIYERAFGLTLFVACTSASAHLISADTTAIMPAGNGGVVGYALGEYLIHSLSGLGTLIILGSSFLVGLLLATEGWVLKLPSAVKRVGKASGSAISAARSLTTSPVGNRCHTAAVANAAGDMDGPALLKVKRDKAEEEEEDEDEDPDAVQEGEPPKRQLIAKKTKPATSASRAAGPKVNFPLLRPTAAEPYPREIENWPLPSLSLLHKPAYGFSKQQELAVRQQAKTLERTLEEFRLDAHVVEIDTGPVITMFELKLGAGIKVSQVASLSNDIARALKAHAIRVVAPIPGKNTIGIEVPNLTKEKVRLYELITLAGRKATGMHLPLFLGKDASGAVLVADLTRMPHLLIAGTTGSGKSVCINSLIVSLLMTKRPDHVKMILVDPKMVELSQFKDVPHLMCPIITDVGRAEKILEWAVTKMDERYELLAEARVKNIGEYNNLGAKGVYQRLNPSSQQERARIVTRLPYIVIVIDELADLMMTAAREVEHHLSRLAQKSRAVGVHIIVATQRPEAKVVTGLIKSNLPCRIAFRVASRIDSRIVLDQNGGEVLMGQGDMLFLPPGSHKLIRAQGTFLETEEIQEVLQDLSSRAKPEFHPELVRIRSAGTDAARGARDPLFGEAARLILESKRGSVSLLQRRLTIGFSRASRLIDEMADAGIVGEHKGSQAREVTMTLKEWEALDKQVAADRKAGYEADQDDDAEPFGLEQDDPEVPALTDDHDIHG